MFQPVVGCWHGYLSGARCRFAYGPADTIASLSLTPGNPDWFWLYLSGTSSPGSLGQNPESRNMVVAVVVN